MGPLLRAVNEIADVVAAKYVRASGATTDVGHLLGCVSLSARTPHGGVTHRTTCTWANEIEFLIVAPLTGC